MPKLQSEFPSRADVSLGLLLMVLGLGDIKRFMLVRRLDLHVNLLSRTL